METAIVIWVMCLACCLHLVHANDTDNLITITPAKLNLTTETAASGGTVTILCEPPKVGVRTLVRLGIQRNISSSPNATVVNLADVGNDRGHRIAKVLSNTIVATVTGSIGEKYLQLTMSRMSCRDDGVYICESSFFIQSAGNIVKSKRINASLSIEVMPADLILSAIPSDTKNLAINETLTMICRGSVGTVRKHTEIYWIWEYRLINDNVGDEKWLPYDGGHEDFHEGLTTKPHDCYQIQSSNLTRKFTLDDKERIYRCSINKDGRNYTQFAAEFRVAGHIQVSDQKNSIQDSKRSTSDTNSKIITFLKSPAGIAGIAVLAVLLAATTTTVIAVRTCLVKLAQTSARPRNDAAYNSVPAERKAAPEEDDPDATSLASYSTASESTVESENTPNATNLPHSAP